MNFRSRGPRIVVKTDRIIIEVTKTESRTSIENAAYVTARVVVNWIIDEVPKSNESWLDSFTILPPI